MAELARVKMRWDGFIGGPGYSVFHFGAVAPGLDLTTLTNNAVSRVDAFATAIAPILPYQAGVQAMSEVDIIESTTGDLLEVRSGAATTRKASTGTASDNFAAAVGAVLTWRTGGVRNGRRVKGRTFLVPLNGTQFENNGTLRDTARNIISNNADEMYTDTFSVTLGVYARPTPIKDSNGDPTGEYNADGQFHRVTSHSVPDFGAVLRSRRD